jgi:hypothetical protein
MANHQIRHSSSERLTGFVQCRIRLVFHAHNELLYLTRCSKMFKANVFKERKKIEHVYFTHVSDIYIHLF